MDRYLNGEVIDDRLNKEVRIKLTLGIFMV